jgi:hypothetical protein
MLCKKVARGIESSKMKHSHILKPWVSATKDWDTGTHGHTWDWMQSQVVQL